jgi:acyl-coenzyme A thioesterase PaaI-like protein
MAGAALAGNAEIAGGLIINAQIGRDYTCVCKKLSYRFLRPCKGHAEYRLAAMSGMEEGVASGEAFNLNTTLHIYQTGRGPDKVVGKAEITFHLVPKNKVGASLLNLGGSRKGES